MNTSGKQRSATKQNKKRKRGMRGPFVSSVPKSVVLSPDKMVVDLTWREDSRIYGSATVAKRWHTNACFDVDPAVGGSTINGFNTWSVLYAYNRVLSYDIQMEIANVEVVPLHLDFVHLNADPGVGGSSYPQWATQAYGYSRVLGSYSGQGSYTYRARHSIRQIVGDRFPVTTSQYTGSSGANPADLTFFGICVRDPITSMPNGLVYTLRLTLRVQFFDRKNVDDT